MRTIAFSVLEQNYGLDDSNTVITVDISVEVALCFRKRNIDEWYVTATHVIGQRLHFRNDLSRSITYIKALA